MKIIIDGYNLIGIEGGLYGDMERKRENLVGMLIAYRLKKQHDITVVFDGYRGESHNQTSEYTGGICIVYSKIGETADTVIMRMAKIEGNRCIVVSSDKEIRSSVTISGASSIRSGEFLEKLLSSESERNEEFREKPDEGFENEYGGEPDCYMQRQKKGNPRKLSKKEKARRKGLSKL